MTNVTMRFVVNFSVSLASEPVVGQAQLGGDGQHHREEQGQQHRLQGNIITFLMMPGTDLCEGVLLAAHATGA